MTLVKRTGSVPFVDHIFFEICDFVVAHVALVWSLAGSQLRASIVQLARVELRAVFVVEAQLGLRCQDVGLNVVGQISVDFVDDLGNLTVGARAVDQRRLWHLTWLGLLALTLDESSDCAQEGDRLASASRRLEHSVLASFHRIERLDDVVLLASVECVREPHI